MGDRSKIEWLQGADGRPGASWNIVRGCTPVSAGCAHCWAARQAVRQAGPGGAYEGLVRSTSAGPRWTGAVRLRLGLLDQPLRWRRSRRIFPCSMGDLFHDAVPDSFLDEVFLKMGAASWHTFLVLTKRPERMARYLTERWYPLAEEALGLSLAAHGPMPNVWLGVSVENQATADERIPQLLQAPAAVHFVSCEPLLGPLNLQQIMVHAPGADALLFPLVGEFTADGLNEPLPLRNGGIDWVIVGGESGPGARPMHVAWIRSLLQQCRAAGVRAFVKQLGAHLRNRKGADPAEWPQDLRVRAYPEVRRG